MSESLPGFEILEKIGKGGMAEVWKARQISLDRTVAIKVLKNRSLPDEEARARFRTEAQAAARVNHPGIVQVYDAGEQNGVPYYVMEYVEGQTLGDLLVERKTFPEENALIIAECVAMALGHAWEKAQIVHCDIKPDNVLVASDGSIKIADLGLARLVGQRTLDTETVLGTPNYVSPEQAEGRPDLDCRSDIYSLGAMLHHLLTGQLPFGGSAGSSAMELHISGFLPDPLDLRPDLSPAVAWLLEKLMIKDRAKRPQSWPEVLADIRAAQKGQAPSAPLPEPGQSTVRRSASRPLPTAPSEKKRVVIADPPRKKMVLKPATPGFDTSSVRPAFSRSSALAVLPILAIATGAVYAYIFMPRAAPTSSVAPAQPAAVVEESAPRPEAKPDAPVPAARTPRAHADGDTISWQDPEFLQAARLFNEALEKFTTFQKTRQNRADLKVVESNCREAIQLFESCRARAPEGLSIQPFIDDCYHLISDVRHSTIIGK